MRNAPSPEVALWADRPDLMDQPPHSGVQLVLGWGTDQALGAMLVAQSPLPVADRVGVHHEALAGVLGRPVPKPHDPQHLGSLL